MISIFQLRLASTLANVSIESRQRDPQLDNIGKEISVTLGNYSPTRISWFRSVWNRDNWNSVPAFPPKIFIRKPRIVAPFFFFLIHLILMPISSLLSSWYFVQDWPVFLFFFFSPSLFFLFFLRTNINFPQAWKIDSESFIQPVVVVSDKFFIASKECLVWFVRGTKMSGQILDEIRFREIWSWHNLRLIRIFVFPFFSQFKYSLIFPFILFPKLCTISLKRVVKKFGRNF